MPSFSTYASGFNNFPVVASIWTTDTEPKIFWKLPAIEELFVSIEACAQLAENGPE